MTAQEGKSAPVIITAFASAEARQGETWKIFLQAEDLDGDMNRILCTLEFPGGGPQTMSIIGIRNDRRRNMSGYIYWNTASPFGSPFATCRLTIQIQDNKGNTSTPISFPLSLSPRAVQQAPPQGVFQDENLGAVQIPFPPIPAP